MPKTLTIAVAGKTLKRSYNQVLRLLMLGHIRGGQDERGRWWVDTHDLARYQREQAAADEKRAA